MDIKYLNEGQVHILLSRRNLETLLSKLDRPVSNCTLYRTTDKGTVWVTAEADEVHYAAREAGPVHLLDDPNGPSEVERLLNEVA